jgi:hypothetical protein
MIKKHPRLARIFSRYKIDTTENLHCAQRYVVEVANWRANDIQNTKLD